MPNRVIVLLPLRARQEMPCGKAVFWARVSRFARSTALNSAIRSVPAQMAQADRAIAGVKIIVA